MSPFIRQSLSRAVLKTLVKSNTAGSIDYNKAFGNVTALFGSALGSKDEVQIPLPQSEKPRFKPTRRFVPLQLTLFIISRFATTEFARCQAVAIASLM